MVQDRRSRCGRCRGPIPRRSAAQINGARIQLPDSSNLVAQLASLERRTSRGTGRDIVDHPPGGHDDLANAVAGACHLLLAKRPQQIEVMDLDLNGRLGPLRPLPKFWPEWWPREYLAWDRGPHGRNIWGDDSDD